MEENKKNKAESEKEIVYSQTVKAGKRIYYIDVKKNRKDEMFLAITESKKVISGNSDEMQVNFEKHKIFLYREDFENFSQALHDAISFIQKEQGYAERDKDTTDSDLNFDIKF
ncbi:MAG: PUR family DNA/RNA-binding protein [Candidatus Paraprevotella stercoravium]|jgi:hypothetical protein|uniref:DUF3276 family protein n=2 Tax=Bacteroidales TaxID=171549 RepID=A0ABT7U5F4_9BACE|nr:PUR family DNA/RNA-binding protein [Candidatus Paraprevotella stercoravium]MDM8145756.1 DUF3276 family protein [Bacteroides eggerthii]